MDARWVGEVEASFAPVSSIISRGSRVVRAGVRC